MPKKNKPPSLQERIARLASFGPVAMAAEHMASMSARIDPRTERAIAAKPGTVAVIPVRGVIVPREDSMSKWFGEVGAEDTVRRVQAAVADKAVKVVVLDVDSPGGSTSGVMESVAAMRAIETEKPIIAHADFLMASAAYWLATGADQIEAAPSAMVGWCGVLWPYADEQKMWETLGVKFTSFAKPDEKGDGWGMWENTEKFHERRTAMVAETYDQFAADIIAARNVDKAAILADWASGFNAPRAKLLNMIDKVRPISELFAAYTQNANAGNAATGMKKRHSLSLLKLKRNTL